MPKPTTPGRLSRSAEIKALVPELPREYRGLRVDRYQLAELLIDGLLAYAEEWDCPWTLAPASEQLSS
jgi:hypothetical protein